MIEDLIRTPWAEGWYQAFNAREFPVRYPLNDEATEWGEAKNMKELLKAIDHDGNLI